MRRLLAVDNNKWTPEALNELAQMLGLAITMPVAPVIAADEPRFKLHPAAKYFRRIGACSLFLGIARMMPPSLYWWQMAFIWIAGCAFIMDVFYEEWKPWIKCAVALGIVLLEIGLSVANGVFDKVPTIEGVVMPSRDPAGCIMYQVSFPVQMDLDRLSLRFQFPVDVAGFKIGTASEFQTGSMAWAEVGLTPDGECQLTQSTAVDTTAVNSILAGPGIVRVNARDVSRGVTIWGAFVLSKNKRSFSPPVKFAAEGSYSFNQRGRGLMSKSLTFSTWGTVNAK